MKTSLKLFLVALIVLFSNMVFAQRHHDGKHKEKADSAFAKVSERLKLTPDQQTKLKEIMKQNRTEMKQVREANKEASKEDRRKAMLAQLSKSDERVKAILNDSQKAEYTKIKAERKELMKQRRLEHKKKKKGNNQQGQNTPEDDELLDDDLL